MNLANKITMARVVMIPLFIFIFMDAGLPNYRYIAAAIFILASLTDALDGYIARSRNLVTNFGKFIDPLADKLLVSAALICLVELGQLSAWIVIIIISREFIITGFRLVAALDNIVIAASITAKFKTASQMIMIILLILNWHNDWFDLATNLFIWLSVIFAIVSAVEYIAKNKSVFEGNM